MPAHLRFARPRHLACFLFEGVMIFGLLHGLAALNLRFAPGLPEPDLPLTVILMGLLFVGILLATQTASVGAHASLRRELILFAVICVVTGSIVFAVLSVVTLGPYRLPQLLVLQGALIIPVVLTLWRFLSVRFNVLNFTRERILIVGTSETAREVSRWIGMEHSSEHVIIGFAGEDEHSVGKLLAMGARIQTDYESLSRFSAGRVDRIIVALDEKRGKLPVRQLMELRLLGIEIEEATSFFERVSGKIAVETMLPSWLIFSAGFKTSALRRFFKRCADISHSLVLLILASPLMLFVAALIKLNSRGPALYRQSRVGLHGHEFNLLKFRSMRIDAESLSGPVFARANDTRVTAVGRVMRALRIDELPQLINVLRGEMSFVGPRPERGHFVRQLEKTIPYYGLRLTVRPGVTGWAQVEYGYAADENDALEKLKYDLYYIKNSNLLFDLWIVLKTIRVVVSGSGAR